MYPSEWVKDNEQTRIQAEGVSTMRRLFLGGGGVVANVIAAQAATAPTETVTLVQLPAGQTTKQVVATLQTTTGGAFSFSVTPQINTTYQAQWKNLSESSVIVQVAPLIKLPYVSRTGYFHFYVTAGRSFAGHFVFLQRLTLSRQWVNIRQLALGSKSGRIMSLAFVRASIPRGRWSVRIFMPASEVGDGYLETASGTQPVVKH